MKRLYVIGPVAGINNNNIYVFDRAKKELKAASFNAEIPHDFIASGTTHEEAMRLSINRLTRMSMFPSVKPLYDGVAMLPGWENSVGARLEKQVAEACGIPCKTVEEWLGEA